MGAAPQRGTYDSISASSGVNSAARTDFMKILGGLLVPQQSPWQTGQLVAQGRVSVLVSSVEWDKNTSGCRRRETIKEG